MTLAPVTLAVIGNGLTQVASEMDMVHEKTSLPPVISEAFDRSNGVYHPTTGEVIAQRELGLRGVSSNIGVIAAMQHCSI